MINFKIVSFDNGVLSVEKAGKPLQFRIGEVVNAEVMEILPTGSIEMKIKGSVITAKTSVPMEKDSTAYFKVTGLPADGKELRLQYLGSEPQPGTADARGQAIAALMKALSSAGTGRIDADMIRTLLKSMPADASELPREVRVQLQTLLAESLKSTGQGVGMRLESVLTQLLAAGDSVDADILSRLKKELMLNVDQPAGGALKTSLQNTGVALEAKLRAEVLTGLIESLTTRQGGNASAQAGKDPHEKAAAQTISHSDLKAVLLGLKAAIEGGQIDGSTRAGHAAQGTLTQQVDGLLKDIETFQLLSKATASFYTFLPLDWKQLRDGDIAFKQGGDMRRGTVSSCRINLNLSDAGHLSVLVMKLADAYSISFWAEQPALKRTIENHIDDLKKTFRDKGLSLQATNVLDEQQGINDQFDRIADSETAVNIQA